MNPRVAPGADAGRKRLVVVGPVYPYRGGIAHFTEALYGKLIARGHDVSLVSFSRQYPDTLFPGATQFDTEPRPDAPPAARLLDSIDPRSWWRAAAHIRRLEPGAVLFQHWMPFFGPTYGTLARLLRRGGIPSVALVHNALPHEPRPGDRLLSRYFFDACTGYTVLSEQVARDLAALKAPGRIAEARHPVYDTFGPLVPRSIARVALGIPERAPVLLFFGMIRAYKGLHVLLDAMPEIRKRLPDVHLIVAGEFYDAEADYRQKLEALGSNLTLHARYIPNHEVATYFGAADLVVQPYVSATQSGVAQLAFHFERPVVVTDVGGLPETVPDGVAGLVIPLRNPAALASAALRFFEGRMGPGLEEGVKAEKQKYGWGQLVEALEGLLPASGK